MIHKRMREISRLFAVVLCSLVFASFSTSLDGRAVVVEDGVFPQGLFAKAVGYLPGDVLSVTGISGSSTADLLVIGALDPSEGVAIMLSPEAAAALGMDRDSNNIVKITKRSSQDGRVYGSAMLAKPADTAPDTAAEQDGDGQNAAEESGTDIIDDDIEEKDAFAEENLPEEAEPPAADDGSPDAESDFAGTDADTDDGDTEPSGNEIPEPESGLNGAAAEEYVPEEEVPAPAVPEESAVTPSAEETEPPSEEEFVPADDLTAQPSADDAAPEAYEEEEAPADEAVVPDQDFYSGDSAPEQEVPAEEQTVESDENPLVSESVEADVFDDGDGAENSTETEAPADEEAVTEDEIQDDGELPAEELVAPEPFDEHDDAVQEPCEEEPDVTPESESVSEDIPASEPYDEIGPEPVDDELPAAEPEDDIPSEEPAEENIPAEESEPSPEPAEEIPPVQSGTSAEFSVETAADETDAMPEDETVTEEGVSGGDDDSVEDAVEFDETYDAIILVPAADNPPEPVLNPDVSTDGADSETPGDVAVTEEIPESEAETPAPDDDSGSGNHDGPAYGKYLVPSLGELTGGSYYIQIAVLKDELNIMGIIEKYSGNYPMAVVPLSSGSALQVMVGPLSMDEYGAVLERFRSYGFRDAFLRKIK